MMITNNSNMTFKIDVNVKFVIHMFSNEKSIIGSFEVVSMYENVLQEQVIFVFKDANWEIQDGRQSRISYMVTVCNSPLGARFVDTFIVT